MTGTDTVVLVIAGLGFGGAERSALSIASGLLVDGYRVRLVTLADSATAPAYSFPPQLGLRQLGLQRSSRGLGSGICNNLVRLWHIRAAVDDLRAPTVISFVHQTNVLTVLALWGTGARVIVCEETEPSVSAGSAAWDALRRLSYRHAAHVVVRAQAALGSLSLPGTLLMSVTRYRRAGLFVSASRRESCGLAIAEAMASGCTVLATNCPSGPGELIDSAHDGLLVPNEDIAALAAAMSKADG